METLHHRIDVWCAKRSKLCHEDVRLFYSSVPLVPSREYCPICCPHLIPYSLTSPLSLSTEAATNLPSSFPSPRIPTMGQSHSNSSSSSSSTASTASALASSISNRSQQESDLHLFTSLANVSNNEADSQSNDINTKRTPTTLKSTRSSEYRIKDFKKPFQHKKRISCLYIDELREEDQHLVSAASMASSAASRRLLWTASSDKTIICWNLSNGKPLSLFQGHTDTITSLKRRDSLLFSASYDRTIRIWDLNVKYQHCIDVIQDRENWLLALELWRNYVLCAGYARNINLYDIQSKQKVRVLTGHSKRIEHLFVDDCILYSSSVDGTVRLWDLEQGGTALNVIQARDYCFKSRLWQEKWLLVGQQEDVMCCNLEQGATALTQHQQNLFTSLSASEHSRHQSSVGNSLQQHQTSFVGLSTFCVYDFLLIGWNRSKRRFEFWNLVNTLLSPPTVGDGAANPQSAASLVASHSEGEHNPTTTTTTRTASPTPKLIHTIDTDILLCSALYFVPGVLFFVSGTRIGTQKVNLDLQREAERIRWFTHPHTQQTEADNTGENASSSAITEGTSPSPSAAAQEASSSGTRHRSKRKTNSFSRETKKSRTSSSKNQDVQQPAYSLYPRLFHYFTETLLYPSTKVANGIEALHQQGKLVVSSFADEEQEKHDSTTTTTQQTEDHLVQDFDTQVLLLGEYLRSHHHHLSTSTSGAPLSANNVDPLQFSIYLNSKQESESSSSLPQIYTAEELSLDFESRIALFYKKLQTVTTNVIQPTVIVVRRDHLVFDAFKHFTQLSLNDLKKPLYVFFANERGLDSGGLTAEMYRLLSEQILDEDNALFENHKNTYFPNPKSSVNETHLQYFKFIGRLIGKALSDMQLMKVHFSCVLFKYLIGKRVTFSDLQYVDRTMYMSLKKILELDNVEELNLDFTAEIDDFGKSNTFHLLNRSTATGEPVRVTSENKYKFVELISRWLLIESVRYQVELLLEGVYEVIPKEYFQIFNEKEIELLLCGNPELDLTDWKEHTQLEDYDENDEAVHIFWSTVEQMNHVDRGKLLCFVTGTSNPPSMGFVNMNPNFCIARLRGATKDHLPHAQTCVNRISIPDGYDSVEWCYKKLMKAIEGGTDFGFA